MKLRKSQSHKGAADHGKHSGRVGGRRIGAVDHGSRQQMKQQITVANRGIRAADPDSRQQITAADKAVDHGSPQQITVADGAVDRGSQQQIVGSWLAVGYQFLTRIQEGSLRVVWLCA